MSGGTGRRAPPGTLGVVILAWLVVCWIGVLSRARPRSRPARSATTRYRSGRARRGRPAGRQRRSGPGPAGPSPAEVPDALQQQLGVQRTQGREVQGPHVGTRSWGHRGHVHGVHPRLPWSSSCRDARSPTTSTLDHPVQIAVDSRHTARSSASGRGEPGSVQRHHDVGVLELRGERLPHRSSVARLQGQAALVEEVVAEEVVLEPVETDEGDDRWRASRRWPSRRRWPAASRQTEASPTSSSYTGPDQSLTRRCSASSASRS